MSLRVVFFGTPLFAVPCLQSLRLLQDAGEVEIVCVVTQPDRPFGRTHKLKPSAIKEKALNCGLKLVETDSVKKPSFYDMLKELRPDVFLVVAFGQIFPQELLDLPRYGAFNVHGSLLPRHRGASPIQASLLAGDDIAGVSLQRMVYQLDAGDVFAFRRYPLVGTESAADLFPILSRAAADIIKESFVAAATGLLEGSKQSEAEVTFCGKMEKKDALLSPTTKDALMLEREVRAYYAWPISWMMLGDKRMQVWKSHVSAYDWTIEVDREVGDLFVTPDRELALACLDGTTLVLDIVKVAGQSAEVSGLEFVKRGSLTQVFTDETV